MDDLPSPIALLMRRSTDGGQTWGPQQVLRRSAPPTGHGDPSLLVDRDTGTIFCFHDTTVNAEFWTSGVGQAHDDPDITQADYSRSEYDGIHALSVFSDDHGATWRTGEPVGPADENKTVELSTGEVLLVTRATPRRLAAISSDGGATYGPLRPVEEMVDPADNGSIIRAFPDAEPGTPQARVLLAPLRGRADQRVD